MLKIIKVKVIRFLRAWIKLTVKKIFSPLVNRSALLQFMVFPFSLYFIARDNGFDVMLNKLSASITLIEATLYAIPFYSIWCIIEAIFHTVHFERNKGKWYGREFVYNEPLHLKTICINADETIQKFDFLIEDAELNTLVSFHVAIDGAQDRIKSCFSFPFPEHVGDNGLMWQPVTVKWKHRLKEKYIRFNVNILPQTSNSVIRIYAIKWEI